MRAPELGSFPRFRCRLTPPSAGRRFLLLRAAPWPLRAQDGRWYTFDDGHVSRAQMSGSGGSAAEWLQRDAYVLFYQRRELGRRPPGAVELAPPFCH